MRHWCRTTSRGQFESPHLRRQAPRSLRSRGFFVFGIGWAKRPVLVGEGWSAFEWLQSTRTERRCLSRCVPSQTAVSVPVPSARTRLPPLVLCRSSRPQDLASWGRLSIVSACRKRHAPVAQRIEHLTTDQKVGGSNPFWRTNAPLSAAKVGPGAFFHSSGSGSHSSPAAG